MIEVNSGQPVQVKANTDKLFSLTLAILDKRADFIPAEVAFCVQVIASNSDVLDLQRPNITPEEQPVIAVLKGIVNTCLTEVLIGRSSPMDLTQEQAQLHLRTRYSELITEANNLSRPPEHSQPGGMGE